MPRALVLYEIFSTSILQSITKIFFEEIGIPRYLEGINLFTYLVSSQISFSFFFSLLVVYMFDLLALVDKPDVFENVNKTLNISITDLKLPLLKSTYHSQNIGGLVSWLGIWYGS